MKRTVSIPKWMDDKAVESVLSLSHVLEGALEEIFRQETKNDRCEGKNHRGSSRNE